MCDDLEYYRRACVNEKSLNRLSCRFALRYLHKNIIGSLVEI